MRELVPSQSHPKCQSENGGGIGPTRKLNDEEPTTNPSENSERIQHVGKRKRVQGGETSPSPRAARSWLPFPGSRGEPPGPSLGRLMGKRRKEEGKGFRTMSEPSLASRLGLLDQLCRRRPLSDPYLWPALRLSFGPRSGHRGGHAGPIKVFAINNLDGSRGVRTTLIAPELSLRDSPPEWANKPLTRR